MIVILQSTFTAIRVGEMQIVKVLAIVLVVAGAGMLIAASTFAQQPSPAARRAIVWCPDVPASPAPPDFEREYGNWAAVRKRCSRADRNVRDCAYSCMAAKDLWNMKNSGLLDKPDTFPSSTDKLQGPFPLPGGANGYILPAPPAPGAPK
jgi:hypothetical protein